MSRLRFGRFGLLDDPRGGHCMAVVPGFAHKRILEVVDVYRREFPAAVMLRVRHLNGEAAPDVAAASVDMLDRQS